MSKKLIAAWPRLGALLGTCILLLSAPVAQAAGDPLDTAALETVKAAHAMLLSITRAGPRLVAVGERGIIVYSDDQGKTWTQAKVPVSVTLTAVQFVDAKHGWAVGHDGVALSSADGALTWNKRFDGNQANALVLAEAQKNALAAHQAADAATPKTKAAVLIALDVAENALFDSQAGAKSGPSRPLLGVLAKGESEVFLVGSYGQIFHSADGGARWESLAARLTNPDGLHLNAIRSSPAGALLIAGEGGKVYRSTDNGVLWQTYDTGYNGQLYGVLAFPAKDGTETLLAYGFAGHSMIGTGQGRSWRQLPQLIRKNLIGSAELTDGTLLLAGQNGNLLRSTDQGENFTVLTQGSRMAVAGMVLLADQTQVALAGIGGVYLRASVTPEKAK